MVAVSAISTPNVDSPPLTSSTAPTRVYRAEVTVRRADEAGTQQPACANTTAAARA